ncbi:MAG: TlpA disulfide reductase family protein [Bacteroidota bacterium]
MKKLILTLVCLPFLGFGQQSLKGTFAPADEFTYAFLYKANPDGADYVNRAQLDSLGHFEMALDSSLVPGMYKIVYAIPPEDNNFDFIYNGKEDVAFDFNLDSGVTFTTSHENKLWDSYRKSMDMVNQTISNYFRKESTDKTAFKDIFKTLKDTQTAYEDSAEGTMAKTFITSNKPYIPEDYEDISLYSEHLKANYLKPVDFNNTLLQSSTFIEDRIMAYVFGFVASPLDNEAYIKQVDGVSKAIASCSSAKKIQLMSMLWQNFANTENETLANYIADTYLIQLAEKEKDAELVQALNAYKNTSLGKKAPDFKISDSKLLSELDDAEHYILVFWSSTCGHCIKELPEVKSLVSNTPTIKVIAYGIEEDSYNWKKQIEQYPNFIHVLGLDKWNNPLIKGYGITATPTYFILNKDKTIIAKPYDLKALKAALEKL